MKYEQLTQDEIDTGIAEAMHGREVEHHQHELNYAVYTAMLAEMQADPNYQEVPMPHPETTWKAYIERMANEALREMKKIDSIHAALSAQLPSGRAKVAMERAAARRG